VRDLRLVAVAVAVVWVLGCAPATIYRSDDRPLEATIESSDATTLRVRDENGDRFALGQGQVADIDHPGNVGFIAGVLFTALGVVMLRWTSEHDADAPGLTLGFGRLFGGMLVFNGVVGAGFWGPAWLRSRRAARPFNDARPPAADIPRRYRKPRSP
jgi:uncharacterized membrane protein YedE/YeeE